MILALTTGLRHRARRARAAAENLRIDIRSDDDSDSSDDSPSPTKSKFPESATMTTSATEKMPTVTTKASVSNPDPVVPLVTEPAAQTTGVGRPTVLQQKQDVDAKGMTQTDIIIAVGGYPLTVI